MGFSTKKKYEQPLVEGRLFFMITKAILQQSKGGNWMIGCRFTRIMESGDLSEHGFLREYIVLVEASFGFGRLAGMCSAIGVVGDEEDEVNGLDPYAQGSVHHHLIGKAFVGDVEKYEDEWKGKVQTRHRIKANGFYPLSKAERAALTVTGVLAERNEEWLTDWNGVAASAAGDMPF